MNTIPRNYPHDNTEKQCTKCQQVKPVVQFSIKQQNHRGLTIYASWCKVCYAQRKRSKYDYTKMRDAHLQATYGISLEEYNALLHAQDDVCAICRQPEKVRSGRSKRTKVEPILHVDHDHVTGVIRGLLCSKCNTAFGMLDENPKRIKALLTYAKRWRT